VAATEAYMQVASLFSKGGFDAKAVAIYKQILRIDANHLESHINLGDHFARMGLESDALREFQLGVKICEEGGLKRQAFDLLKRVAALDPNNVTNRLSLTDLFVREDMPAEAREEFKSLLAHVVELKDDEGIARVSGQMMAAYPDQEEIVFEYATAQIRLGAAAAAVEALNGAVERFPDSLPVHESLVAALTEVGDDEAVRSRWQQIAEMYKLRGDSDRAREILQRHVSVASFDAGDPDSVPSLLLSEETESEPKPEPDFEDEADISIEPSSLMGGLEFVQDRSDASGDASASDDLLAEARVSIEFDDPDAAMGCVQKVLAESPDNAEALELLAKLGGSAPEGAEKAAVPEVPVAAEAPVKAMEPEVPDADDLGDFEFVDGPEFDAEPPAEQTEVAEQAAVSDADFDEGSFDDTLPDIELVLEDECGETEPGFSSVEPPAEIAEQQARDDLASAAADQLDRLELELLSGDAELSLDEEFAGADSPAGDSSTAVNWTSATADVEANLEEANSLFDKDMLEEAEQLYRAVLEASASQPQAMLRLGEIEVRRGQEPSTITGSSFGETVVADCDEADGADGAAEFEVDVDDGFDAEVEAEAPAVEIEEEAPVVESADEAEQPSAVAPDPEPESAEPEADLIGADYFADIISDEEPDEPEDTFDLAAELDEDSDGSQKDGFREVFDAFKKGVEEQVSEEDIGTHYDLAIAYKEMGLLDDAVAQLERVLGSDTHQVEVVSLLATCLMDLGRHDEAVSHLSDALKTADGDLATALRYDLGCALSASGQRKEALASFKRVAAADGGFREVAELISELEK
jgi:tetratricopeptide (TPR) repeat protein